jgi:hypothetical protein
MIFFHTYSLITSVPQRQLYVKQIFMREVWVTAEAGKGSAMTLWLAPTKNNQAKYVKWARDYEI